MKSTGPFDAAPDETMFLRLCWSPDGQCAPSPHPPALALARTARAAFHRAAWHGAHGAGASRQLATTNAFIKNKPCATLLERSVGAADAADGEPWENKISMKGFTAPVTVAAYHPKLLVRHDELDAVCAVGGVEGRLVVWSSLKPEKPLVIISDLFKRQILDATWSDQGYTLALCSDDGTVALILYDPKEVGRIATKAETTKHLQQLYGDVLSSAADADLPEDIGQLSFESITASATTHINGAGAAPQMVRNQQVESKRGGKRRIEPRVLAGKRDEADLAAVALPAATALAPASDSAPAPEAAARPAAPHAAGEAAAAAGPGGAAHAPGAPAPRDVMAGSQPFTNHKVPAAAASAGGAVGALAVAASSSVVPVSKEKVKEANQAALESRKRKDPRGGGGKEDKRARSGEGPDVHGGAGGAGVNLIPPRGGGQPRTSVTKVVAPAVDGQEGALVLRTERSATGWTQISQGRDNGAPAAWTDVLYDTVEALAGNGRVAAVACTEGTLYFFSEAGRRALPAMLLPARVAFLEAAPAPSQCVAALTCDGTLLVWDLAAQRERVRTSLAQLLRAGEAVSLLWLTPGGQPVVAFKSGHCYTFHAGMQCMVRVADDHFRPSKFAAVGTGGVGGAGQLQRAIEIAARPEHPRAIAGMLALDPGQVDDISRAHLETQLASALALGDGAELQVRLAAYARWLVDTEDEVRLREMCEMVFPHRLVGRGDAADEGAGGGGAEGPQPRLLGLSRRALVREVLQEMRRKRSLQRCREELALMLGQEA
jgi:hypothetical protein